jgi:putative hydrolase of the HAD superfamily
MLKPNLDIYHEILGKFNLVPEETLFIDDSLPNIEAAKSLGIQVIHLPNYKELKEKLKEIGI